MAPTHIMSCRSSPTDANIQSDSLCHATSCKETAQTEVRVSLGASLDETRGGGYEADLDDGRVSSVDVDRVERVVGLGVAIDVPVRQTAERETIKISSGSTTEQGESVQERGPKTHQ